VGSHIASRLESSGYDIVVVDNDERRLSELEQNYDLRTICGHASLPSVLERAGCEDADLLIAATTNDEVNMMACQVAYSLFRTPTKIARVRNSDYTSRQNLFGDDLTPIDKIICPERETAAAIYRKINFPSALLINIYCSGSFTLFGIEVGEESSIVGLDCSTVSENYDCSVLGVTRSNEWLATGSTILSGDHLYAVCARTNIKKILSSIGPNAVTNSLRIMLGGGSLISELLSERLASSSHRVTIIEDDERRARYLDESLNSTTVLHGDLCDRNLLQEEGISGYDYFIAATSSDETNFLSSMVANKAGVKNVISVINRAEYMDLTSQIGLRSIVSPRLQAVSSILKYAHSGSIVTVDSIANGSRELVEVISMRNLSVSKLSSIGVRLLGVYRSQGGFLGSNIEDIEKYDRLLVSGDAGFEEKLLKLLSAEK